MSSEKVYLSKDEQIFLMEMLEIEDIYFAVEKFAQIMTDERADPTELQEYIKKIMGRMK